MRYKGNGERVLKTIFIESPKRPVSPANASSLQTDIYKYQLLCPLSTSSCSPSVESLEVNGPETFVDKTTHADLFMLQLPAGSALGKQSTEMIRLSKKEIEILRFIRMSRHKTTAAEIASGLQIPRTEAEVFV